MRKKSKPKTNGFDGCIRPGACESTAAVGAILVRLGAVTEKQLAKAISTQKCAACLGDILVREGYCSSADVTKALDIQTRLRTNDKSDPAIGNAALDIFHERLDRYLGQITNLATLADTPHS